MLVTCENCNAKFKLDDSLVKDSGSKVRCSKCRHVFTAYKPSVPEEDRQADYELPGDPSEAVAESEENSLDFQLFDTEEEQEDLSLEDFGLEDDPDFTSKGGISDEMVSEDEITAADLGFDDEVVSEESPDIAEEGLSAEDEDDEELGLEDLALDGEEVEEAPEGLEASDEEISFEGLSLEEDGSPAEDAETPTEASDQDLSFDELNLEMEGTEEGSSEDTVMEEQSTEETEFAFPDDVPVASMEDGEEAQEEVQEEVPPVPPQMMETPKRKPVAAPFLVVLIVVLALGGGYLGYTLVKGGDIHIPFLESLSGANTDMMDPGNLRITLLEDAIGGEFIDNKSAGRIFVIKGKVKNDYPEMRNFIQVKGILYSKNGKVARDQTVYCGNILSATELQTLGKEMVNRKLNNRFGENKSNFKVPRGKALPFMLAFFDIPQDLGEYSVEVVGSAAGPDK
jgi:predicted Zn finger-like uncharacterized protein